MRRSASACILLAILAVAGCNPFAGWQTERVDVTVVIPVPSYAASGAEPVARMVDPSTWTVDITVSGADFEPIEATYSFDEHGSYADGTGLIECVLEGVPAGPDRVFDVVTRDADGTVLTTGSVVASVSGASDTLVELFLVPALCTDMSAPDDETPRTLESAVDPGRMSYVRVSDFGAGSYELRLTATDDVNLYVFSSDGSILVSDVCVAGSPTDECAELVLAAGTTLYAGVYGAAAAGEALPFTLTVTMLASGQKVLTGTISLELDGHDVSEVEGETLSVALLDGALEGELVTVASWSGAWGSTTTRAYEMDITGVPDGDYYLSASIAGGLCGGWYHSTGTLFLGPSDPEFSSPNFALAPPYEDADFPVGFIGGGGMFEAVPLPDVNPTGTAYPRDLTVHDGALYFTADDGVHGRELWRYDIGGLERLSDINPSGDAFTDIDDAYPTEFGGDLYFWANDGLNGRELWRYDGASATRVSDIAAGADSSGPGAMVVYDDGGGEALYLRATDDGSDYDLWRYNGTGTPTLACELPGSMLSGQPVVYDGAICFAAMDGTSGSELWRCDGSSAVRVSDINAGAGHSGVQSLTVVGSLLYFVATDGLEYELRRYDGSTVDLAADVDYEIDGYDASPGGSMPTDLCAYGGNLFFTAYTNTYGRELYRYDGASVALVADIAPGGDASSQPMGTTALSFGVISAASATGFEPMNREPWFSSGTGAVLGAEVNPLGDGDPSGFTELGGAIYFSARDAEFDYELWMLVY